MTSEQLYQNLLALVEKSEARIDRTNEMVQTLARTCEHNLNMYDKHLSSLEQSRNAALENATNSINVSKDLTSIVARLRDDYQSQVKSLQEQIDIMRKEYREEINDLKREAKEMTSSYRRLAERVVDGSSKAEVKIQQ